MTQQVDELFLYVEVVDGEERPIGVPTPGGWLPLLGADQERADSMREVAAEHARAYGHPVKLLRFGEREELESISGLIVEGER